MIRGPIASIKLGDFGIVNRRRSTGGRQDDVAAPQWCHLFLRQCVLRRYAEENDVQVFRVEVDDGHLVLGQALGGLEDMDRLEPDAFDDRAFAPAARAARTVSNGGTI